MSAAQGTAGRLIEIARSQVGLHEGRNGSDWNNRIKYTTWYAALTKDKTFLTAPYCDIFVSWCARQAGISTDVIPNSAYTPATLNWYKARGRQVSRPQAGDIFYIYYASIGMVGHTGIIERTDGAYVYTLEGNTNTNGSSQGDGVYRLHRAIDSRMRFVRPAYSSAKAVPVPPDPSLPAVPKGLELVKKVSVANLKKAFTEDPAKKDESVGDAGSEVFTLEYALVATEWLDAQYADGHYGTTTVDAVKEFQKKHSPEDTPDGWLGKEELTLLFKLAQMNVSVIN